MAGIVLSVDVRERTGKGGARDARRRGMVPGVLYGGPLAPVAIEMNANAFRKVLTSGKFLGHMVELEHKGETQHVIPRDIQFDPVSDVPVHFDVFRVEENQLVRVSVPVKFAHADLSPGLKHGGTLNVVHHTVDLWAPANAIPEALVFDMTGLEMGTAIRLNAVKLGDKVTPAHGDADQIVATIVGSAAGASEASSGDAAAE
jgi:large subunit ribosomal protein L25